MVGVHYPGGLKKKKPCRQKEEKILQGNCKGGTLNTLLDSTYRNIHHLNRRKKKGYIFTKNYENIRVRYAITFFFFQYYEQA